MSPEYIIQKLRDMPKERKLQILPGNQRARICCPWHRDEAGNIERTPSFFIHIVDLGPYKQGSGHCFSCGKNVRDFHVILDPSKEGQEKETEDDDDDYVRAIHTEETNTLLYGSDSPVYDLKAAMEWSPQEEWRTIPGQLMVDIGAKMIFEPDFKILMAYLPCLVNEEHVGGIRARLESQKGKISYYNVKGSWVLHQGLFPYDYTKKLIQDKGWDTLVAVEGSRDALRHLVFGIPSLAVLGTGNISEEKMEYLFNLGVKRVVTAFDPDAAGLKATRHMHDLLKGEMVVQRFDFEKYMAADTKKYGRLWVKEKMDPGNAPDWVHHHLKKLISQGTSL